MAKHEANKLKVSAIAKLTKPGRYNDGLGLYLEVRRPGDRSWTLRYVLNGKQHYLGLGPLRLVGLAEARVKATEARKKILDGIDPVGERHRVKLNTFEQVARQFLKTPAVQDLKNPKHKAQWESTLVQYAFPAIGNHPIATIDSAVVASLVLKIWERTPETANRVRSRIERIFAWAKAHKLFDGDNPASRDVLKDVLPKRPKVEHQPALPYADLPALMASLEQRDSVSSLALQFTILTAVRTQETTGARWSEIDLKTRVWVVPADRTKTGKDHRVPLSDRAVAILSALPRRGVHVFINGGGKPISNAAMAELIKPMRLPSTAKTPGRFAVVHGFRSTFSDWAHDCTGYEPSLIELALAHVNKDKVAAAYRRGDALDKRRPLMVDWEKFVTARA